MAIDPSRITLRHFEPTDVDDVMSWVTDDQVTRFTRWNTLTSKEEALTFIKEVCIPNPCHRSICIDNRSIGIILVQPGSEEGRYRADITYAVGAKHWGQGIGTTAIKMAVSGALKEFPDLVRFQGRVDIENKASQRVLEKAGFSQEGLLRKCLFTKGRFWDLYVYSYLPTDPKLL